MAGEHIFERLVGSVLNIHSRRIFRTDCMYVPSGWRTYTIITNGRHSMTFVLILDWGYFSTYCGISALLSRQHGHQLRDRMPETALLLSPSFPSLTGYILRQYVPGVTFVYMLVTVHSSHAAQEIELHVRFRLYVNGKFIAALIIWRAVVAQSVQFLTTDRRPGFDPRQRRKDFSSSLCVQTGSGAHPASCTMDTGGYFLGVKPGRSDADRSPSSSAEVKNEEEL
jgi:hypothetical protein